MANNNLKTPPFHLFVALFSHPFYTFFKRIAEQCGLPVSHRRLHLLLESFLLFYLCFRLASSAVQVPCDPIGAYLARKPHLYDGYLLACVACFLTFTLVANWQLFLGPKLINSSKRSVSWQGVAYDLTVRNFDQAQACRRLPQRSTASKLAFLSLLLHQIDSGLTQKHLNLDKLRQPRYQLRIFPFLSVQTRKKLLQFQFASNCIARVTPFLNLIVPCLGLTLHLLLGVFSAPGTLPLFGSLLLLSDITLSWIFAFLFYRNGLLIIYFETIISLAIWCHLRAAHRLITFLMVKGRSGPLQSFSTWNRLLLQNFLSEHAQICTLLDATNQQLLSLVLLVTFLLNAPTNIYLVYRLFYRPILLTEYAVIFLLTVVQTIALVCTVLPLALANKSINRTSKYLPGVQLSILRGERCRPLKMKYEILQSTLTESRVKSGASFGPLCLITFESLYKVVSLYAAYMLVLFDLLPK